MKATSLLTCRCFKLIAQEEMLDCLGASVYHTIQNYSVVPERGFFKQKIIFAILKNAVQNASLITKLNRFLLLLSSWWQD